MRIAERMEHIEASGIRRVFDLAASLENPVNLSIGQPDFDVPEALKEAAIRAIKDGKNGYTPSPGLPALRERVSAWLTEKGVEHGDVMITPGASAGLTLAFMVMAGPGDEVIIPDPFFVSYKHLATAAGAKPVFCETYPDFKPDPAGIESLINERTVAVVLNSPNNPTGAVYDEETIRGIAAAAARHGVPLISDECYDALWYDAKPFSPAAVYPNTITINSLSKLSAMTGWRLGFAAGPGEIIDQMTTLQQFTFVCAPQPVQWAAIGAFDIDFEPTRRAYKRKRDILYEGIRNHFDVMRPEGAFYLFPKVPIPGMTGEDFCVRAIERNLLSVPGGAFSARDNHLRLSFAAPDEKLEEGARILCGLAEELKK